MVAATFQTPVLFKLAEDLTGWRQGDALGQPLATVFSVVHQRTRQTYRNPVSQVLATGEIVDLPDQSILLSRAGQERMIAASAAPIRDLESKIVGSVLVFRDISDQQAIMEERVRASKLESLGILAGGIAHGLGAGEAVLAQDEDVLQARLDLLALLGVVVLAGCTLAQVGGSPSLP